MPPADIHLPHGVPMSLAAKWLKEIKIHCRSKFDSFVLDTRGLEFYVKEDIAGRKMVDIMEDPKHQELVKEFHQSQQFRRLNGQLVDNKR